MSPANNRAEALAAARAAYRAGDYAAAEATLDALLAQEPDHEEALFWMAMVYSKTGRAEREISCLQRLCDLNPQRAAYPLGLAMAFERGEDDTAALRWVEKALAIAPDLADAHRRKGELLYRCKRYEQAVPAFGKVVELEPDNSNAHRRLGETLVFCGREDEAFPHVCKAVDLDSSQAPVLNDLGVIYTRKGDFAKAEALYRRTAALQPQQYPVHYNIANIHTYTERDEHMDYMEERFANESNADEERWYMAFALAKAYDDLEDYGKAWHYLTQANALKRASINYDIKVIAENYREVIESFPRAYFPEHKGAGEGSCRHVFLVGMPRSGSTLSEHIMASHSQVVALGETEFFGRFNASYMRQHRDIFPRYLRGFAAEVYENLGREFDKIAAAKSDFARVIADKTLNNFYYFAMIKRVFPDARFVHCVRDPLDTCLSIYKRLFAGSGHPYAYSLDELGITYRLHMQLLSHWKQLCPGDIHTLHYRDLVENPQGEVTRLLNFAGLEFEAGCLDFHQTERSITTASVLQVRQPINRKGLDIASAYDSYLEPLKRALADTSADIL